MIGQEIDQRIGARDHVCNAKEWVYREENAHVLGQGIMVFGDTTSEHANQHWKSMGPVIARYNHWSGPDHTLRWQIVAPYRQEIERTSFL